MSQSTLGALLSNIHPVSDELIDRAQRRLDLKTKPRGSLGRLEWLACRICAVQDRIDPQLGERAIVVMAADHGVAAEGVSAYPQEVTGQMLLNFANGGAAINVLAKQADARVVVVDMGVSSPVDAPNVRRVRIAPGTQNMRHGAAMSRDQALSAIAAGGQIADELSDAGVSAIGIGEMGIANTTASSAIAAVLTGVAPEEVTGLGTGIDDATRARKIAVIRDAIAVNRPDSADPLHVLSCVGGFEIAGLAGVVLGAAARRRLVVVDGFISSVAALVAVRLQPNVRDYLVTAHKSVEPGHQIVLRELGAPPLLDLAMRLGEGTGAALAMQLITAAAAVMNDMASFDSAGVTDTGK